jgi:hypothetical protein
VNQYAITWGAKKLRNAIARQMGVWQGIAVDPEKEVTVCCGSTEAMISTLLAVCNAGDEVVIFEPFYENYGPDAVLSGARPRFVKLRPPVERWGRVDFRRKGIAAAFDKHTKAIIVNTPNNPTGKVFTRAELELIRDLCVEFDVLAITDEIYEHILFDGTEHISMASLEGMRERTVTINGMSKTYSVTGWRVGWAVGPEKITNAIRKVHDFLTVGAPAPLQEAGATALSLPAEYYAQAGGGLPGAAGSFDPGAGGGGVSVFSSARSLLRDDGYFFAFGFEDDVSFYEISGEGHRSGGGAGVEFLSGCAGWGAAGAVCVLQESGDAGCGGGEVEEVAGAEVSRDSSLALGGQPRRLSLRELYYFVTTPQAMRSPELPEGSVFMSSALAWMTMAVPPLLKSEWAPSPRVTSLSSSFASALPLASTVKFCMSPA